MIFQKGQTVSVTDFKGRKLTRTVWEDRGGMVFISSRDGCREIEAKTPGVWPIGVPRSSVTAVTQSSH